MGMLLTLSTALLISVLMNTAVHMLLRKAVGFFMKKVRQFLTEKLMIYNKEYAQMIVDPMCSSLIKDYMLCLLKETAFKLCNKLFMNHFRNNYMNCFDIIKYSFKKLVDHQPAHRCNICV